VLTHSDSVHLRYTLLLNALAGLVPSLVVKGRVNDPLRYATWWTYDQHSAVLVVSATAIVGTVLVYLLIWRNLTRWWTFLLCGILTAALPGLFYLAAAPLPDQMLVAVIVMLIIGVVWGALVGLVIYGVVGKQVRPPAPNNRWRGP
jgi:Na+/melibiose symporter-like transporter